MKLYGKLSGRRLAAVSVADPRQARLMALARHGLSALGGFVLSGAGVFSDCRPFALAFISAVGGTGLGFSAAGGAIIGCLIFSSGLKYAACAVLVLAGAYILKDLPVMKKVFFPPLLAAVMVACVGTVYAAAEDWRLEGAVLLALEVVLTGAFAWFFSMALKEPGEDLSPARVRLCRVLLIGAALTALQGLYIGPVSPGHILAAAVTLYCARTHDPLFGAAAGIILGLAMDAAVGTGVFFTAALALAGLTAGVFARKGRILSAVAGFVCIVALTVWDGLGTQVLPGIYEGAAGAFLSCFVPDLPRILPRELSAEKATSHQDTYIRGNASRRLQDTARAFSRLGQTLSEALSLGSKSSNTEDVSLVFVAAADKTCRKCKNRKLCWSKEDTATLNACNDATPKLRSTGEISAGDFPAFFSSRCENIAEFCTAVNREYAALMERRRSRVRQQRSQEILCRQYGELGQILSDTAAEFSRELSYDSRAIELLERYLKNRGSDARAIVYSDAAGRLHAELEGPLPGEAGALAEVEKILGTPLVARDSEKGVHLSQKEPLRAIAGSACAAKSGQQVSGDSVMYFRSETGVLFIILSDGMGSGPDAMEESRSVSGLLESFLKAGVEPEVAMRTLNSALSLKTGALGAFATVDLMQLDLFSGRAAFFKLGAAPTYIKRGQKVSRITAAALPPGTGFGSVAADVTRLTLAPGDMVIMTSDGLTDKNSDGALVEKISKHEGKSPRLLATELISSTEGEDDVTVFAIRIEENK